MAVAIAFVDNQAFALQRSTVDFVAIAIGFVVSLRPAAPELTFAQPLQHLTTVRSVAQVAFNGILATSLYWALIMFAERKPWYSSSSSSNVKVAMHSFLIKIMHVCMPLVRFLRCADMADAL